MHFRDDVLIIVVLHTGVLFTRSARNMFESLSVYSCVFLMFAHKIHRALEKALNVGRDLSKDNACRGCMDPHFVTQVGQVLDDKNTLCDTPPAAML